MNVYMYAAALFCEECGKAIREELDAEGKRPEDADDETSYDSNDYPKGPYPNGGGESDSPQHCDGCQLFLENDLTSDGSDYVRSEIERYNSEGTRRVTVYSEWFAFYSGECCIDLPEIEDPEEQDDSYE